MLIEVLALPTTGLRLPQAAFRGLVPGRSVHRFNGSWHRDEGGLRQEHVVASASTRPLVFQKSCVISNEGQHGIDHSRGSLSRSHIDLLEYSRWS